MPEKNARRHQVPKFRCTHRFAVLEGGAGATLRLTEPNPRALRTAAAPQPEPPRNHPHATASAGCAERDGRFRRCRRRRRLWYPGKCTGAPAGAVTVRMLCAGFLQLRCSVHFVAMCKAKQSYLGLLARNKNRCTQAKNSPCSLNAFCSLMNAATSLAFISVLTAFSGNTLNAIRVRVSVRVRVRRI